jgi:ribonuclease VapC
MRLSTKLRIDPVVVGRMIQVLLDEAQIGFVPTEAATGFLAIETFAAYGKGRAHPAQLNLADCLSYACAKRTNLPLLYKGRDFANTGMA